MARFDIQALRRSTLGHVVITTMPAVVVLTAIGPFGTYTHFSLIERVAYWTAMLFACGPVFELVVPKLMYSPKLVKRFSRDLRFGLGVVTSTACAFWLVLAVEYLSRGPFDNGRVPHLLFGLLVIGGTISFFRFIVKSPDTKKSQGRFPINYERVAFFRSHPDLKGERVLWISMQDHYARVSLKNTEVLIHQSMSQLDQQLENYPGLRIHRSHWVAFEAIQGLNREGRSIRVDLGDGQSLPVGGKYLKQVELVCSDLARSSITQNQSRRLSSWNRWRRSRFLDALFGKQRY